MRNWAGAPVRLAALASQAPSSLTSPPSMRACSPGTAGTVTLLSVKLTSPRARVNLGVSGLNWMSLPVRVTLPCTVDLSRLSSGNCSLSL